MARNRFVLLLALAGALVPGTAIADVLEVGSGGHTWIAGGSIAASASGSADALSSLDDVAIPEHAFIAPDRASATLPDRYESAVKDLSARFDLSPALIEALVWQESRWRENAVSLYPARAVYSATLSLPFSAMVDQTSRKCDVTLLGEPLAPSDGDGEHLKYERCSMLVREDDVLVAPSTTWDGRDRFILADCIHRLAMYLQGYRGALSEPTDAIFVPSSSHALLVGRPYMGPRAPWLPTTLRRRCPQLEELYFGDVLASSLLSICPSAISPPQPDDGQEIVR